MAVEGESGEVIRWLEREEMQFDEHGDAVGFAWVKVLQYAVIYAADADGEPAVNWKDVPTVRE